MERELWPILYRTVREVAAAFSQKYVQIPGWVLLVTMLWAALHGAGMQAKGYKLHTIWAGPPVPETWEVTPLNVSEKTVARGLIAQLTAGGYLLTDGNYDASVLFDRAAMKGYQQVSPLPRGTAGGGHHYQSPHRLRSIALMQHPFGKRLHGLRGAIERDYGNATSFGGGLAPLPAWVRGLHRVRTWVWAKLLINAARIIKHKDLRQV